MNQLNKTPPNRSSATDAGFLEARASVHMKHRWDPMLGDHPAKYHLEDLRIAVGNSVDPRENTGVFWKDLIKYYQEVDPASLVVAPLNTQVQEKPAGQPDVNVVMVPQEWQMFNLGQTHFHLLPSPLQVDTQTRDLESMQANDSSQCSLIDAFIVTSECTPAGSPHYDIPQIIITPDPEDSVIEIPNPENATLTLRGRKRGRGKSQPSGSPNKKTKKSPKVELTAGPKVTKKKSTDNKKKNADNKKKSTNTKKKTESKKKAAIKKKDTDTKQENYNTKKKSTTSSTPRKARAVKVVWYARYKSQFPDPVTGLHYCTGCLPGREYKYKTNSQLSRHATRHRFTGVHRRYHCFGCKDNRKFCRMDALQRHMVKGEMYKECLARGLYSEYDEHGVCILYQRPVPEWWEKRKSEYEDSEEDSNDDSEGETEETIEDDIEENTGENIEEDTRKDMYGDD
ncbi:hypothetical protein BGZ46_002460 [Entomortierella lignicola]|nr:hypothetical protein BGZ46_002460 [Entomortierella lignicola]